MLERFESCDGYLERQDIVWEVAERFGAPFARTNDHGNLTLSCVVLKAFRELTPGAVWDRGDRAWRRREFGDERERRTT